MTRDEAESWNSGAVTDGDVFWHVTPNENVESITTEGFKPSIGVFGEGVYLGIPMVTPVELGNPPHDLVDHEQNQYSRMRAGQAGKMRPDGVVRGTTLLTAVNVRNPLLLSAERSTDVVDFVASHPATKDRWRSAMVMAGRYDTKGDLTPYPQTTDYLRELGYDAIIYGPTSWPGQSVNGGMIVVFDTENVTAITDDFGALVPYRYAKSRGWFAKFNPYHDPRTGRFTTGPGGTSGPSLRGDYHPGKVEGYGVGRLFDARTGKPLPGMFPNERNDTFVVDYIDDDTVAAIVDTFTTPLVSTPEKGTFESVVRKIEWVATDEGSSDEMQIQVEGDIMGQGMWGPHDTNPARRVGTWSRIILPEAHEVYHDTLFIDTDVQGRGIAKAFTEHTEAHYKAQGITHVSLEAGAEIGGYAWARAGFNFLDGKVPASIVRIAETWANNHPDSIWRDQVLDLIRPTLHNYPEGHKYHRQPTAYDFASLGYGDNRYASVAVDDAFVNEGRRVHPGAAILLGSHWNGVKWLTAVTKATDDVDMTDEDWEWVERACAEQQTSKGRVTKFNPYHDPHSGRFTTGPGGISDTSLVRGFRGRDVPAPDTRVAVYRDLSDAPRSGFPADTSFSIKKVTPTGGLTPTVQAHTTGIRIAHATARFDAAARAKAIATGKRGVHAYVDGDVVEYRGVDRDGGPSGEGWKAVTYYPDIGSYFDVDTRRIWHGADEVVLSNGRMWALGSVLDEMTVPKSKFEKGRDIFTLPFDDVTKFNPYHDQRNGQFTTGPGGAGFEADDWAPGSAGPRSTNRLLFHVSPRHIPLGDVLTPGGPPMPGPGGRQEVGRTTEPSYGQSAVFTTDNVDDAYGFALQTAVHHETRPLIYLVRPEGKTRFTDSSGGPLRYNATITDRARVVDVFPGDYENDVRTQVGTMTMIEGVAVWGGKGILEEWRRKVEHGIMKSSGLFRKFNPYHDPRNGQFTTGPAGSSSSPTPTLIESKRRLQSSYPDAIVDFHETDDPSVVHGLVNGFERLAKEFPDVAKRVVLFRTGDNNTEGLAETQIVTARRPDGRIQSGYAFILNTSESGLHSENFAYLQKKIGQGEWGTPVDGVYPMRSNVMSMNSVEEWAEGTGAVHEFGHAVHMTAISKATGRSILDAEGTGKNPDLWTEAVSPHLATDEARFQHAPFTRRLEDYVMSTATGRHLPPSIYAVTGHAEIVAESFAFRYGPAGVGLLGATTLDATLSSILDEIEAAAR